MDAQPWVVVGLTGLNIVVVVTLGLYFNGPRRKRLLDEIALRDATDDPKARRLLNMQLQRGLDAYSNRRTFGFPPAVEKAVTGLNVVCLVVFVTIAFTLERGKDSIALSVGSLVSIASLTFARKRAERQTRAERDTQIVTEALARAGRRGPRAKHRGPHSSVD